ncbi:MAG: hypothetical protein ACYCRG_01210 [Acidimicrobiales bacterium]
MTDDSPPLNEGSQPQSTRPGLSEGVKTLIATVVAVLAIAVGVALFVSHERPYLHCTTPTIPAHLSTAPSILRPKHFTNLPPSRDNDSGRSRPPDSTPDADNDVMRRTLVCH